MRSKARLDRSRELIARQSLIVAGTLGSDPTHRAATRVLLLLQDGLFELEQAHGILVRLSGKGLSEAGRWNVGTSPRLTLGDARSKSCLP